MYLRGFVMYFKFHQTEVADGEICTIIFAQILYIHACIGRSSLENVMQNVTVLVHVLFN